MKQLRVDNLDVRIYPDRVEAAGAAALMIASRIHQLLRDQPQVNIVFAAAPSQNELLSSLVKLQDIDWSRINGFHMDEYLGLATGDLASFSHYLNSHLFSLVQMGSIHFIDPGGETPEQACKRYGQLLQEFPPDIVCLGIGENGHLAFNDPHVANFTDPAWVKVVELDQESRSQQVHDGCFPSLNLVPTHAITLTIPALFAGRFIFCVVPGSRKAKAVYDTLCGPISTDCPASILRRHPQAALYLDNLSSILVAPN
jgi:glucosamine-6-phosphate deaminase